VTRPDTDRPEATAFPVGVPPALEGLVTETSAPGAKQLDGRSTRELVELMNDADASVPTVVAAAADDIAAVVDAVVERMARGGRLVYAGAGTSGRLAELDAAECESTFSTAPGQVVALVAGEEAVTAAERDAAEDDEAAGSAHIRSLEVGADDAVVVVSASGRTPYALGAARAARAAGAWTAAVVSVPDSQLAALVDREIRVVVGPELLAGSTRLKAGTAQKLVLNTISTVSMIRLGKTYRGLMVDVASTNEKLQARARQVIVEATGVQPEEAAAALDAASGSAKVAIVSLLAGIDAQAAAELLDEAGGSIDRAMDR
jgi:N-acetylmuramic acid 6-phosphate etherase